MSDRQRDSQDACEESRRCIAARLFGQVRRIKATGQHAVDPGSILEDFESEEGVMYYFCKGCGLVFEVNRKVAEDLAALAGIPLPVTIDRDTYFEGEGCEVCDGDRSIVQLRRL